MIKQEEALSRFTLRLPGQLLKRLKSYVQQTGAVSDSAAVQFILLSYLNSPEKYPIVDFPELHYHQNMRTSFTLTTQSILSLEQRAKELGINRTKCLKLALCYTLYNI